MEGGQGFVEGSAGGEGEGEMGEVDSGLEPGAPEGGDCREVGFWCECENFVEVGGEGAADFVEGDAVADELEGEDGEAVAVGAGDGDDAGAAGGEVEGEVEAVDVGEDLGVGEEAGAPDAGGAYGLFDEGGVWRRGALQGELGAVALDELGGDVAVEGGEDPGEDFEEAAPGAVGGAGGGGGFGPGEGIELGEGGFPRRGGDCGGVGLVAEGARPTFAERSGGHFTRCN